MMPLSSNAVTTTKISTKFYPSSPAQLSLVMIKGHAKFTPMLLPLVDTFLAIFSFFDFVIRQVDNLTYTHMIWSSHN